MIYSFKRFHQVHRRSRLTKLAKLAACVAIAPFALALTYTLATALVGGVWFLMSKLGDPDQLTPYSFMAFAVGALYLGWESLIKRKLYRRYLASQSLDELQTIVQAPSGEYGRRERRMAADAWHAPRPAVLDGASEQAPE